MRNIPGTLTFAVMLFGIATAHATPSVVKVEYIPRQGLLCSLLPSASIKEEWKTELLKEHASEPERVRNHLHLQALQKAVLLKLNEADALKAVITIDSQLPGGYYKRAWEIVNASDGEYLKYVAEVSR